MNNQSTSADQGIGPRQIIVCCDGTNNTLTGGVHDTNVLKLIGHLAPDAKNQVLYYDPGVGSPDQMPPIGFWNEINRKRERIAGMADGKGVYENIGEAYSFLVENFEPGDQIYIFGFSRGAFTARCVAGMVHLFGIVRNDCKPLILTLIRVYFSTPGKPGTGSGWGNRRARRAEKCKQINQQLAAATQIIGTPPSEELVLNYLTNKKERGSTRDEVADQVREQFTSAHGKTAAVHFIGVWDTVESVGVPLLSTRSITSTGDTRNKDGFRHIRHALSMDEHRWSFQPRLYWDEDYDIEHNNDPANRRSLRQRWFRGVHSDIGGGYDGAEAGLSDQAYCWMVGEAIACGLRTKLPTPGPKPYIAHDACYATPWWGVAGLTVRTNVTHIQHGHAARVSVIAEGVAAQPNPTIYPVWIAGLRGTGVRFWIALAGLIVLFAVYGMMAYRAFYFRDSGFLAQVWQGAAQLDAWQRWYTWRTYMDPAEYLAPLAAMSPAFWATIVNFGIIAAYSWLLGLFGTWAFRQLAGRRRPEDKVSPILRLGFAPMVTVLAGMAENILTIVTLWTIYRGWLLASGVVGVGMMLANVVKWCGVIASGALLAAGVLARMTRR